MSAITRHKAASEVAAPGPARSTSALSSGSASDSASASKPVPPSTFVKPKGVHADVHERGYPLGFESLEQFRDLTRSVAQANRTGQVIVSGSSVTGRSATKGTLFDKNPEKPRSDIDLGVVRSPYDPEWNAISNQKGFPIGEMAKLERSYGSGVRKALGRPSGIKFFDNGQIARDGRSYMVRPHTPPPSPRGEAATRAASTTATAASAPIGMPIVAAPRQPASVAAASSSAPSGKPATGSNIARSAAPGGGHPPGSGGTTGSGGKI